MRQRHIWVCVYDVDQAFGGPEEGGWWYETGYPLFQYARCFNSRHSEEEIERFRVRLFGVCKRLNKHEGRRYPISSVASEGQYMVRTTEGELPAPYPSRRPYYS
jgi:hypothetical protein